MIRVGNIKAGDVGEYCGRAGRGRGGSPLANPFPLHDEQDRDAVCDRYQVWFDEQLRLRNPKVLHELDRLEKLARQGDITLTCWCNSDLQPRRCHCDKIKSELERRLTLPLTR